MHLFEVIIYHVTEHHEISVIQQMKIGALTRTFE